MVESGKVSNFGYQLQLASGQIEDAIQSREQIRQLLNGLYGGITPDGLAGFDVKTGVHLDRLPLLKQTRLVDERTLDFYADQYARNGIHGTLNWYRNREQNFKDELGLEKTTIDVPVLFITATKDEALPPSMSRAMDKYIPDLTRKEVDTHHWALWEQPEMPGSTLAPKVVKQQPALSLPSSNTSNEYLLILVDPTANLSSPLPTSLLWFQTNITFASSNASASSATEPIVPYLAPSVPGHVYIALLYKQPPNFIIPSDFPYNNSFRKGFNVTRLAVDFKTGGPVAGNFFELDPYRDQNASTTAGAQLVPTSTAAVGKENATSTISLFQFATAAPRPFVGAAERGRVSNSLPLILFITAVVYIV
ncbi:MAG: hypothetical protein Q9213_008045 [Squamulea squamosa]